MTVDELVERVIQVERERDSLKSSSEIMREELTKATERMAQMNQEIERYRTALEDQIGYWQLAAPLLNECDRENSRPTFMAFHNPIALIEESLAPVAGKDGENG